MAQESGDKWCTFWWKEMGKDTVEARETTKNSWGNIKKIYEDTE